MGSYAVDITFTFKEPPESLNVDPNDESTFPVVKVDVSGADPVIQALLLRMASFPGPAASLSDGEECLRRLREKRLARRLQELQDRLEKAAPGAPVDDLIRQKVDLRREMRALRSTPAR